MDLDLFQKKAAYSESKRLLISAPAGSGKTRVLMERIRWLVEVRGVSQQDILVLTFAREAAKEIRERLSLLGLDRVEARTFHSWAYRLAQQIHTTAFKLITEGQRDSLQRQILVKIYQSAAWNKKIKKTCRDLNWSPTFMAQELIGTMQTLSSFGWHADSLASSDRFKDSDWQFKELLLLVWQSYEQLLHKHGAYDFPLLIKNAMEVLESRPKLLNLMQRQIKYLLVDEVQDANIEEQNLLERIRRDETCVTYVGDFNQAIYAWRGAAGLEWSQDRIGLRKNYRSDGAIVGLVNNFLNADYMVPTKDIQIFPSAIAHKRYDEQRVITRLLAELKNEGYTAKDIMVLARTHSSLEAVDRDLLPKGLKLKTVHAAKGLEAKVVILINCSDDRFGFPLPKRLDASPLLDDLATYDQPAEERRIFYVAMTRAQERLILMHHEDKPSPYLSGFKRKTMRCVKMEQN